MPKRVFKNPEERARKISQSLKGHPIYQSKERNEKISKALKGKHCSPRTEFKKGRKSVSYWKGKKMPIEIINKLKDGRRKGKNNPAWRGGISKKSGYKVHYNRIRKARLKEAVGNYSFEDWENLKKQYNYTCLSCKKSEPEIRLTADHIIPLSRGGSNYIDNIQPLCAKCNSSKHTKIEGEKYNTASLVVGAGEVGIALYNILKKVYQTYIIDENSKCFEPITYLHICFPYDNKFIKEVKKYQNEYKPTYTIIHSTVILGTNRILNSISSPTIGIHPYLEKSLEVFTKFIGGEEASQVADYFKKAGIKIYLFDKPETTEAMKILSTHRYSVDIEFTKMVKRLCDEHKIPFEAWTIWTQEYNQGYQKMGYPELTRPILIPIMTKLGGHCLIPNLDLLETEFSKLIKRLNED